MKTLLHTIVLIVVTLYSMSGVVMWTGYFLRADVIAETSCVNPDKPSCRGRCHIARLMTREKKDDGKGTPVVEPAPEKPVLFHAPSDSPQSCSSGTPVRYAFRTGFILPEGHLSDIFHPPSATA